MQQFIKLAKLAGYCEAHYICLNAKKRCNNTQLSENKKTT